MTPNAHSVTLTLTDGVRAIDFGTCDPTEVVITWRAAGDARVRPEHRDLVASPTTYTHTYELVGPPIVWTGTTVWWDGGTLTRRAEARARALRAAHRAAHPSPQRARVVRVRTPRKGASETP